MHSINTRVCLAGVSGTCPPRTAENSEKAPLVNPAPFATTNSRNQDYIICDGIGFVFFGTNRKMLNQWYPFKVLIFSRTAYVEQMFH